MIKLSQTLSRKLTNGMNIWILPSEGVSVQVMCAVSTGSIHEAGQLGCGLSHFLEHMLFQGCRDYPGTAAAETIRDLGGNINAYTSYDKTVYHTLISHRHWESAITILSNMVRYPLLPEDRFELEKEVILRECDRSFDQPAGRLFSELAQTVFRTHPVRIPIIGFREQISQVTRQMALDYHSLRYNPCRCNWVITGNVDPEKVFALLEKLLGSWKNVSIQEPALAPELPQLGPRHREFYFKDTLSRLMLGIRTEGQPGSLPAQTLLWGLLGMGSGSVLPRILERENPLALEIRTFDHLLPGGGMAGVSAAARHEDMPKLLKTLQKELSQLRRSGITKAEVEREKYQQYAEYLRRRQDPEQLASELLDGVLANGSPDFADRWIETLKKTSASEVQSLAEKQLDENCFNFVIQYGKNTNKTHRPKQRCDSGFVCSQLPEQPELLWKADPDSELVQISFCVPGGALFTPDGKSGISPLTLETLTGGAGRFSEEALLQALDECGADLSVNSGYNSGSIDFSVPKSRYRKGVMLLKEILSAPHFPEEVFFREQRQLLELLANRRTTPLAAALDESGRHRFGKHPYRCGSLGESSDIEKLTVSDLKAFYASLWARKQFKIGISGLTQEQSSALVGEFCEILPPDVPVKTPPEFSGYPQLDLRLTLPVADRDQCAAIRTTGSLAAVSTADRSVLDVFKYMENGLAAELFVRVREKKALAYSVGAVVFGGFHPGRISFYAQTSPRQYEEVLQEFQNEIDRLANGDITDQEFFSAREQAAFNASYEAGNPAMGLSRMLLDLYYGNRPETARKAEERIMQLTREDFTGLLAQIFGGCDRLEAVSGQLQ